MKRAVLAGAAVLMGWSLLSSPQAREESQLTNPPESLARPVLLGPVRGDLGIGLAQLESSTARCAAGLGSARARPEGEAALRLEIETIDGGLRVVDALVDPAAGLDAAAAACARDALRGQVVPSRLARAGTRFQMPFRLQAPAAPTDL